MKFLGDEAIRSARWDDLKDIIKIDKKGNRLPWPRSWFEREMTRPFSRFFVLENRIHKILGFVIWWQTDQTAEILNLSTHSAYKRQGVASKLLHFVLEELTRAPLGHLDLEVNQHNLPALALYKKNRFDIVGLRKKYYRDGSDAILMRKLL